MHLGESNVFFTPLIPGRVNTFDTSFCAGDRSAVIVVDNSVHTGNTAIAVLDLLKQSGVWPSHFFKLVDYDDELEEEAIRFLKSLYDIDIVSLFGRDEIAAVVPFSSCLEPSS